MPRTFKSKRNTLRRSTPPAARAGSTLLIVVVLLGMLSLVGFLFYTFAAMERTNAANWADGNKIFAADSDTLVDFGLAQLLIGPRSDMTQSALYGGRHSLLPNLFGRDISPYNSEGIRLTTLPANPGIPVVDQDYDEVADPANPASPFGQEPLEFNDSGTAQGWTLNAGVYYPNRNLFYDPANPAPGAEFHPNTFLPMPDPGVDYTYPDINNIWLAYKGFAVDANGNTVPVIIPSFHRPQLLRYYDSTASAVQPFATWYDDSDPLGTGESFHRRILRPHPLHRNPDGNFRFPKATALGGTTLTTAFPFAQASDQGVWSLTTPYVAGTTVVNNPVYDVDNDGDGILEGIWMDLGYPVVTINGLKRVALYSFTIYDLDALLNLNVHGNVNRQNSLTNPTFANVQSLNRLISTSNQGLTPAEVNPQYAFSIDPNNTADLAAGNMPNQYQYQFGAAPANILEARNMEWYRVLTGTANFQTTTTFSDLYVGRYGEASTVLYPALQQGVSNGSIVQTPLNLMPFPGITGTDDNWNKYEGQFAWEFNSATPGYDAINGMFTQRYNASFTPQFFPATLQTYSPYPHGQPLDYKGDGTIVNTAAGTYGKSRLFVTDTTLPPYISMKFPGYVGYDNPGATSNYLAVSTTGADSLNRNSVAAGWHPDSLLGTQMVDLLGNSFTAAGQGPIDVTQTDEDIETIADPAHASPSDSIFPVEELGFLQVADADQASLSITSRLKPLAPMTFSASTTARRESVAKRFTPLSNDRKQFGMGGAGGDTNYARQLALPTSPATFTPVNLPAASGAISPVHAYGDDLLRRPWEFSDLLDRNRNSYFGQTGPIAYEGLRETFPPAIFTYYDTTAMDSRQGYFNSIDVNLPALARNLDPFRAPVRKVLEVTSGNTTDYSRIQFRLSLNHLTTTDGATDYIGNVIQRGLSPHDPNLTATAVVAGSQEARARLDRQQMARDIYVMLYMLGGGLDYATQNNHNAAAVGTSGYTGDNSLNPGPNRPLYSDRQLREMAQFAVNVVDALDPDHVMTRFEYDKNLGNGWGDYALSIALDDNAYTDDYGDGVTAGSYANSTVRPYRLITGSTKYDPNYPHDSDERGIVYGVEAQEMTFSEVLAFQCPKMQIATNPQNNSLTEHNEEYFRYFTYVELRNISPNNIDLGAAESWRLRAVVSNPTSGAIGSQRYLKFRDGTINSGEIFTLGNAGESDPVPQAPNHSRFRAANDVSGMTTDWTMATTWIAPSTSAALQLDLLEHRDQLSTYKFQLVESNDTPGDNTDDTDVTDDTDITNIAAGTDGAGRFFNDETLPPIPGYTPDPSATLDAKPTAGLKTLFILERRQYADRPAPGLNSQAENDDNPWIPVDQFELSELQQFDLLPTDNMVSQIQPKLRDLLSKERSEPLNGAQPIPSYNLTSATSPVANSVMLENTRSTTPQFGLWQVVYDRPFASPVELLQIPLYGPQHVTQFHLNTRLTPKTQQAPFDARYPIVGAELPYGVGQQISVPTTATAAGKILVPESMTNLGLQTMNKLAVNDNRWYRLFELYEVPTRTHRQLGNPFDIVRTPGKLNLNGLRHPDVLAGLLDDANVLTFDRNGPPTPNPTNLSERLVLYSSDPGDTDANMTSAGYAIQPQRDWWVQFLQARDGRRTTTTADLDGNGNPIVRISPDNVSGLYLPGLADSSPFRSFAAVGFTQSGTFSSPETALDQTLFRRLPYDMSQQTALGNPSTDATFNTRHLWEVGDPTEHQNSGVDPVMRDRLLSKIYNNTTTRSHTFAVFMSVRYFEADDTTNGPQPATGPQNVLIGGPDNTIPGYRGFFVIDRSKPEEAYDPNTQRFTNYRNLVKYQLQLP